jgi:transposase InsO family protein
VIAVADPGGTGGVDGRRDYADKKHVTPLRAWVARRGLKPVDRADRGGQRTLAFVTVLRVVPAGADLAQLNRGLQRFAGGVGVASAVFAFIEGFYNPRRRHSTLGYLSPAASLGARRIRRFECMS